MKTTLICLVMLSAMHLCATPVTPEKKSFIIKPAPIKESVNTLKEQVATSIQQALKEVTSLQEQTSQLLKELAATQRQLLKAGSSIVQDKQPFKKATKESLAAARTQVTQIRTQLSRGTSTLAALNHTPLSSALASTTCLGITPAQPTPSKPA